MRKWIIALGTIALDTILLYIGSFFLYWGTWNYIFGSRIGIMFGPLMMVLGVSILVVGIFVIFKLIAFLWRTKSRSKQEFPISLKDSKSGESLWKERES